MTEAVTVAVTGASGFLGRALVGQLVADDVSVVALSRRGGIELPRVTVVHADIGDVTRLTEAFKGVAAVFHLAAHVHDVSSIDDSPQQQAITLGGTLAVLEAAERADVRQIILASSLAVYGAASDERMTEGNPCRPVTPYGLAKLQAEEALRAFTARTGATGAAIRPAMMYGHPCPGNLSRMIRAVRAGWFPPIPEFGNRRSMVSVEDAATAMRLAWRREIPGGRPYNITDGESYSTRELYDLIRSALGRTWRVPALPRALLHAAAGAGDIGGRIFGRRLPFDTLALSRLTSSAWFDESRARTELEFQPTTNLRILMPALVRELSGKA